MKQINVKLLAILFLSAVVTLAGAYALYRFQKLRNSSGLLDRAVAKMEAEEYREAAKLYSHYLRLRPDDTVAYVSLANALREQLKIDRAEGTLNARTIQQTFGITEEALRKNPDNHELRRAAVDFSLQFHRYPDAISHLNMLLEGTNPVDDSDGELRVKRATCFARSGQDDDAVKELCALVGYDRVNRSFDQTKASAPNNVEAYRLLALIANTRLRDANASVKIVDHMISVNKDSYMAYLTRSQFASAFPGFADNEADILQAVRLAPDEPVAILSAADYYLRKKSFEKAEKLYNDCRKKFPDNVGAYRGLSSLALATGRYDDAVEYLNDGLERGNDDASLLWARGNIELDKREFEKVEKTKEALIELKYPRPYIEFLDARVDLANGKWLVASKSFEEIRPQIAQYRPSWLPGLDGAMALCYEQMGKPDLRLKAYERIIEASPENLQARWGRVQSLLAMGQLDKATDEYELIEKGIRKDNMSANVKVMTALLQMELLQQRRITPETRRDYGNAADLAKDIYDRGMIKDPKANRVVQDYFRAIGQPEKAEQLAKALTEMSPNSLSGLLQKIQKVAIEKGIEPALQMLDDAKGEFNNPIALRVTKCELLARVRPDDCKSELKTLEADLDSIPKQRRDAVIRSMGRVYMMLNEYSETSRLWERLAEDNPQDIQIRLSMFELAMQAGDAEEMQKSIANVESVAGRNSAERKWCEAAKIAWSVRNDLSQESELDMAQGLLTEAISQRDGWDPLYRLQGDIHAARNQPQAAIEAFEKSLQLSVGHPNVFRSLARLYYADGRFGPAERMLDDYPKGLWTQNEERMKMDMLARKGKLPEKLPYDENSQDATDHEWVGKLLANAARMDEAEIAFQKAKKLAPERVSIWSAMALKYVSNKEPEKLNSLIEESASALSEGDGASFRGQAYSMLREWKKALEEFKKASEIAPEDLGIKRAIADVSMKAGNRDDAEAILDEMIKDAKPHDVATPPNVRWARRAKAELLGDLGSYHDYTEGLKLVESNGTVDGRLSPADLVVWARLSLNRPDGPSRELAIKKIEKTEEQRDLVDSERRLLADLFQKQDRWTECKSVMLDLLADNPSDMRLLNPWLTWLLEHGDLQQASRWAKNCPETSVAYIRTMAELETRQKNPQKALQRLGALVPADLESKDADNLRTVASILEHLAKFEPKMFPIAEKMFRRYTKMNPKDELSLAGFLGRRGQGEDLQESIDICANTIAAGNPEKGFQLAVGVLRRNRQSLEPGSKVERQVRALFEKQSQGDPDNPSLILQRSEFEDVVGQPLESERLLKRYMEFEDVSPRQRSIVANNLAYMLALQGETERSNEYIQIAVNILGPTADLRDTIGMVYYAKGEYVKAIREFEAAIGDGGATAFKHLHRSMAELANKNGNEAARAFRRAVEMGLDLREMNKLEIQSFEKLASELKTANLITVDDLEGVKK